MRMSPKTEDEDAGQDTEDRTECVWFRYWNVPGVQRRRFGREKFMAREMGYDLVPVFLERDYWIAGDVEI